MPSAKYTPEEKSKEYLFGGAADLKYQLMGYAPFVDEATKELNETYEKHVFEMQIRAKIDDRSKSRIEESFSVSITRRDDKLIVKGVLVEAAIMCIQNLYGLCGENTLPVEWTNPEYKVVRTTNIGRNCYMQELEPTGRE